ncbi:MAG: PIG-L family deacetylase [Parcubacteria group bacterium]|nr:PIG-L family deacetylase [Parcubacteria group bacterium]
MLLQEINEGKSIMWIGPHPDDENTIAGTIAFACGHQENECYVFSLKEIDEISENWDKDLRREANKWLETEYLEEYIYLDIGILGELKEIIASKALKIIKEKKPEVILTFSPSGYYGHPEHKATSLGLLEYYNEFGYKPSMYQIINMDNPPIFGKEYFEYKKYLPTDEIDLDFYSEILKKTIWDAKIEIIEKYSSTMAASAEIIADMEKLEDLDKKEYFRKVK